MTPIFSLVSLAAVAPLALALTQVIRLLLDVWESRRLKLFLILSCHIRKFNPRYVVPTFGAHGFYDYWPVDSDEKIDRALSEHRNILLVGRAGAGKSRAAIHHIKKEFSTWWTLSEWIILRPLVYSFDDLSRIRIRKRRYILFLDDLDIYLLKDKMGGVGVFEIIQYLQQQARELVVVGTIRKTLPEFDSIALFPRILGQWEQIEINDWPNEKGRALAAKLSTDFNHWNGTPQSVIQPSEEIRILYQKLPPLEKKALFSLKVFADSGIYFVPQELFFQLCNLPEIGFASAAQIDANIIRALYEKGFLCETVNYLQSFPGYLNLITDWHVTPTIKSLLRTVLINGCWCSQLVVFGVACELKNELAEAIDTYKALARLEPHNPMSFYRLGVALSKANVWEQAVPQLEKAIELSPRWKAALYRLREALEKTGKPEGALIIGQKVNTIGKKDALSCFFAGEMLRLQGHNEDAIEEFKKALEFDRNTAEIWYSYGRALRSLSRWIEASDAYRHAINLRVNWAEAYFGISEPLKMLGDISGAKSAYAKAIELKPTLAEAYTYLSKIVEITDGKGKAVEILLKGIEHCPNEPRLYSYLGQLLIKLKDLKGAYNNFKKATELNPDYAEAFVGLAAVQRMLAAENYTLLDDAEESNRIALRLNPDLASAYFGLGMCSVVRKDWKNAVQYFREAILRDNKEGPYWYYLAMVLSIIGIELDEAAKCLDQARHLGFDVDKIRKISSIISSKRAQSPNID